MACSPQNISREARMTLINFMSQVFLTDHMARNSKCKFHKIFQIGGLMGLCMGFSLLSFIEIVYWITYRLARNARN